MADATRAHVLRALLAVVLSATASCWVGDDCRETIKNTIDIATPADPQMQLLINSCQVDSGACPKLCAAVLSQQNIGSQPTSCTVGFLPDKVEVDVAFDVYNTESSNCYDQVPPEPFDAGFVDGF